MNTLLGRILMGLACFILIFAGITQKEAFEATKTEEATFLQEAGFNRSRLNDIKNDSFCYRYNNGDEGCVTFIHRVELKKGKNGFTLIMNEGSLVFKQVTSSWYTKEGFPVTRIKK